MYSLLDVIIKRKEKKKMMMVNKWEEKCFEWMTWIKVLYEKWVTFFYPFQSILLKEDFLSRFSSFRLGQQLVAESSMAVVDERKKGALNYWQITLSLSS